MFERALWLGCVLVLLATGSARANGRFPRAQRVIEDPRDARHLLLAATYGLLGSSDRGENWNYTCERSFALQSNYTGDPLLELSDDGSQLVGVQNALNRSDDGGCSWHTALGGDNQVVPDYTLTRDAKGDRNAVVALLARLEGAEIVTRVVRSEDAGRSFQGPGPALPLSAAFTIDAAESDPNLIYVSGLTADGEGVLLVSNDAGESYEARPIPGSGPREVPYIAALDPQDARTLYVRTDSKIQVDGLERANDALLVTHDGGETWTELYRAHAKLLGFALAPDGSELVIGYGNPSDPLVASDEQALGVLRSRTDSYDFDRVFSGMVTCLTWSERGLYACTSQLDEGYSIGFSATSELMQSGELTFAPLLDVRRVHGPSCCDSPNGGSCDAAWLATCFQLEACYTSADDNAPFTCAGAEGGSAGSGDPTPSNPNASDDEGCSCRAAGSTPWNGAPALFSTLTLTVALWRRRCGVGPRAQRERGLRRSLRCNERR